MRALLLLLLPFSAGAQDTCGTWQPIIEVEQWPNNDTNWVYDEWRLSEVINPKPISENPCSCPEAIIETQSRINRQTGDIETITRRTEYMYIRREKTEFERTLEQFE